MGCTDIVLYVLMLLFATFMIVWFLVYKKKFKMMYVSAFYILTVIMSVAQIIYFGKNIFDSTTQPGENLNFAGLTAFYSAILIQLFQMGQISELAVQVKLSANKIDTIKANLHLKIIRIILFVAVVVYLGLGIYAIINLLYDKDDLRHSALAKEIIPPAVLLSVAIGLTLASWWKISSISKHFEKEL